MFHRDQEYLNTTLTGNNKKYIVNRTRGPLWVNPRDELSNTSAPKAWLREIIAKPQFKWWCYKQKWYLAPFFLRRLHLSRCILSDFYTKKMLLNLLSFGATIEILVIKEIR